MDKEAESLIRPILSALGIIQTLKPNNGIIECPKCKGKLHYKRYPNKKVYGKCETIDCLSWMM